jgi:ankyrin repeat protein
LWSGDFSNNLPSRPAPADINLPRDGEGNTYLHELCRKNAPAALIREAVAAGADPNILNKKNMPPLGIAVQNARPETAAALCEAGALLFIPLSAPKTGAFNAPYLAADLGKEDMLKELLARGGGLHVNSPGIGADGMTSEWHALHAAVRQRNAALLEPLVAAGAALNQEAGPDLYTPLQIAAANDCDGLLRKLLSLGADLETRHSRSGRTPLLQAVYSRSFDSARILLERGADPNAAEASGLTALMMASETGNTRFAELLLKHKANPDQQRRGTTSPGETALMRAAQRGNSEIIRLLLKAGADPLLADAFNRTAAKYAADASNHNTRRDLEEAEQKTLQAQFEANYRKYRR